MKCLGLLRKMCAVSQSDMAIRAGTSRQSLNEYELGRAFPSRRRAKVLDDALSAILEERLAAAIHELPPVSEGLGEEPRGNPPSPDPEDEQPPSPSQGA